ncbi:hypothetical protein DY000_02052275 [Brassica cretica]|uniref:Uncharacterized protein n=1 Tax=Brassica cretica TaxID=69181 RepID=A0ABQ7A980_BRACR|nr:hypothetical protein DY000_02052275 [Brassica cretica]
MILMQSVIHPSKNDSKLNGPPTREEPRTDCLLIVANGLKLRRVAKGSKQRSGRERAGYRAGYLAANGIE